MIAVVLCPNCEEQFDVTVSTSMGATDLIPSECPECMSPWPAGILNEPSTEVYA
jgi:hypothetical protein